ncbi:MAG: glycoside hydrolase family 97 N-terminal domain-containing protein, partial [Candidatus Eisenbacteria bacterium]
MPRTHATPFSLLATILLTGAIALTAALNADAAPDSTETVLSPDGRVEVAIELSAGVPAYSITRDGRPVIQPSTLGFRFKDDPPLTGGFVVAGIERDTIDETWEPVWGSAAEVTNRCNELEVRLREAGGLGRMMTLIFRVFDDGVGFRYVLPEQQNLGAIDIVSEETTFRFAGDHTVWWIPNDYDSYEHLFRETPLSAVEGANTPVTMATSEGLYVSVHEANLTDYSAMTLVPEDGVPNALRADLVPWPDGVKVIGRTPLATPWRTIQIGESPGDLVESHLMLNLNDPCVIEDTSWIRPMKYAGIWWSLHIGKESWHVGPTHGATTENAKRYVDFAAAHGLDAVLIEGWNTGWDRWGARGAFDYVTPYDDFDLEGVVRYGREKGVAIIGHHETGGDAADYEMRVDEAFDLYKRVG